MTALEQAFKRYQELEPSLISKYQAFQVAWLEATRLAYAECARICEERAKPIAVPDGQEREWGWKQDEARYCAESIRAKMEKV